MYWRADRNLKYLYIAYIIVFYYYCDGVHTGGEGIV